MKHEPRPYIHVEKQLWWASKLGGTESLGISRAGQTVLAMLMQSQIWHQPASSVTLCGEGPLLDFLSGRKLTPNSYHNARHFSFSLYTTGAFQTATLLLELRRSKSE